MKPDNYKNCICPYITRRNNKIHLNMKIGILTHHTVVNFGAFLQAYALQEAISRIRPNDTVEIINYIPLKHFLINTLGWFLWYKNRQNWKNWGNIFRLPFTLRRERVKYMNLSPRCFSADAVSKMRYDIIVIGSDEVWNYADRKSYNPIKFGYSIDSAKLVAYAPSAGNSNIDIIPDLVKIGLNKFSHLSGRDRRTVYLAQKATNKKVTEVLDPTFLHTLPTVTNPYIPQGDYILFYYCEHLPEKIKIQIYNYAKSHGLEIIGAGDSDKDYCKCNVNMTPFQWAGMFRYAKFVFTGTFHGAVFSIINNRQFKVYLTNQGRIAKVGALLDSLGISGRLIDENYIFDLCEQEHEINYTEVNDVIAAKKEISLEYLNEALE